METWLQMQSKERTALVVYLPSVRESCHIGPLNYFSPFFSLSLLFSPFHMNHKTVQESCNNFLSFPHWFQSDWYLEVDLPSFITDDIVSLFRTFLASFDSFVPDVLLVRFFSSVDMLLGYYNGCILFNITGILRTGLSSNWCSNGRNKFYRWLMRLSVLSLWSLMWKLKVVPPLVCNFWQTCRIQLSKFNSFILFTASCSLTSHFCWYSTGISRHPYSEAHITFVFHSCRNRIFQN
jgi:hypothetical protein